MTNHTTSHKKTAPAADENANGLAITSLVLGILSVTGFFFLTGIPAIITGVMALRRKQRERGMSIAGIVMGGIGTLLSLLFVLAIILLVMLGMSGMLSPAMEGTPAPEYELPLESSRT